MWRNYYCLQDPDPLPTPYFSVPSTPTEKIEDRLNLLIELKLELEDGELKTEVDDGSFLCCVAFNQTILVFGVITTDMARFSKPEVVHSHMKSLKGQAIYLWMLFTGICDCSIVSE